MNTNQLGHTLPAFIVDDYRERMGTGSSFYSNEDDGDNTCFYKIDKILNIGERSFAAMNLLQNIDALKGMDMF